MAVFDRLRQAWNAFTGSNAPNDFAIDYGAGASAVSYSSSGSPSRPQLRFSNERTIVSSIYTRISIDVASIYFKHIELDDQGRYSDDVESNLNACLTLEPNMDQGPQAWRQDIILSMFDSGCCAIVPVDTTQDPNTNELVDIYTLRVGKIVTWYPKHVRVCLYNEDTGQKQEITLEKRFVAIVENPLYAVMNAPNSTLQRLIRKLNLLDVVDDQSASGKLDVIIQLPYSTKSEARKEQAERRRDELQFQLKGSQYGIAYADASEKITQLNRPAENNLLGQVQYLTTMLYGQLGITEEVMNGTADEKTMINYYNRTIEPLVRAITEAMQRAFIGHMGSAKGQRIDFFTNPFRYVPITELADIADKFSRNEILAPNEIRAFMGIKPSKDPKADQLMNSNMPQPGTTPPDSTVA